MAPSSPLITATLAALGALLLELAAPGAPPPVAPRGTWVYEGPSLRTRQIGWVAPGGRPLVTGASDAGWSALELGYVPSRSLSAAGSDAGGEDPLAFVYAKVIRPNTPRFAAPDADAGQEGVELEGHVLALLPVEGLLDAGWGPRPHAGFVRLPDVRVEHPSDFSGEHAPAGDLAFAIRSTVLHRDDGTTLPVHRFERFPAIEVEGKRVRTDRGWLPRSAVRLAVLAPRPKAIPEQARWIRVDLPEQTLTAYEGDRPVFATLVSTGGSGHRTRLGVFRVWQKNLHSAMHHLDEYFVEEVPSVMYFDRGEALHGAFWHDHFGTPVSHGCVNLSVIDARWLFEWAPPQLPQGWHSRMPGATDETLWVWVDAAPAQLRPPLPAPPTATR